MNEDKKELAEYLREIDFKNWDSEEVAGKLYENGYRKSALFPLDRTILGIFLYKTLSSCGNEIAIEGWKAKHSNDEDKEKAVWLAEKISAKFSQPALKIPTVAEITEAIDFNNNVREKLGNDEKNEIAESIYKLIEENNK